MQVKKITSAWRISAARVILRTSFLELGALRSTCSQPIISLSAGHRLLAGLFTGCGVTAPVPGKAAHVLWNHLDFEGLNIWVVHSGGYRKILAFGIGTVDS